MIDPRFHFLCVLVANQKMSPANSPLQTFGVYNPAVNYKKRLAAYAVILNRERAVVVVQGKAFCFLPGGGTEDNESPEETVHREVREELGCTVRIIAKIGEAIQYFFADEQNYEMFATFFLAEVIEQNICTAECEWVYLKQGEMAGKFFHDSHEWFAQHGKQ